MLLKGLLFSKHIMLLHASVTISIIRERYRIIHKSTGTGTQVPEI